MTSICLALICSCSCLWAGNRAALSNDIRAEIALYIGLVLTVLRRDKGVVLKSSSSNADRGDDLVKFYSHRAKR